MRLISLIVFLSISYSTEAQNWVEPGAEWHLIRTDMWCSTCEYGYETWVYETDTLIQGKECQVVGGSSNYVQVIYGGIPPAPVDTVFDLYEDYNFKFIFSTSNDTTWFLQNNEFKIMAIMDAEIGDTWSFSSSWNGDVYGDFVVVIDSAFTGDYLGVDRRQLLVHLEQEYQDSIYVDTTSQRHIVEGVHFARQLHPRETCSLDMIAWCDDPSYRYFTCFSSDITPLMQLEDNCMPLISGLNEFQRAIDVLQVFPNPATDYINVSSTQGIEEWNRIWAIDVLGRVFHLDMSRSGIDVSHLDSGNYFILFENPDQQLYRARFTKD